MARPATGQVVVRDGKRGKSYGIRYSANARRIYETVGSDSEGVTEADAHERLADRLAEIRLGIWRDPDEPAETEAAQRVVLFGDFAREWLEGCRADGLSARTLEDYAWAVNHLVPILGRIPLATIGVREVDAFRREKVAEGLLSPNSVNKVLTRLSQILALAVEHELIVANPAAGKRRRLKRTATRQTWCEPFQLMALLQGAEGLLLGRGRALIATLAGAGLRIGEALALTWADVEFGRAELRVRASKTEAGRRTVDLTPALRDELAAWRERSSYPRPSDLVFPNGKGTQDNRNNVRRRLLDPAIAKANRRLVALGIEPIADLTAHGLRRTYATLRHATGDEAAYASAQLGHTDATFTMNVYTRAGKRLERMNAAEREAAECAFAWASRTANGTNAYSPGLRVVSPESKENAEAA